jgi:hypothetical protein
MVLGSILGWSRIAAFIHPERPANGVEHVVGSREGVAQFPGGLDHEVGGRDLLGHGRLGAHSGEDLTFISVVPVDGSDDLDVLGRADDDQGAKVVHAACLDQERRLVAGDGFVSQLQPPDLDVEGGTDPGMDDGLQAMAGLEIGEDDPGQPRAIQASVLVDDALSELGEDRRVPLGSLGHHGACQFIGVEDGQLSGTPATGHGGLPRADSSSQAEHMARHGKKVSRRLAVGGKEMDRGCRVQRRRWSGPPGWWVGMGLAVWAWVHGAVALGSGRAEPSDVRADTPTPSLSDERAGSDRAGHPSAGAPLLLWRAGGPLLDPVQLGAGGEIVVAGVDGELDVLGADGRLRFSVTIAGAVSGPVYLDEHRRLFVPTARGTIVAVAPEAEVIRTMRSPCPVDGGLELAEGLGLIHRSGHAEVCGLTRAGLPTLRHEFSGSISAGPVGFAGFAVVGTREGQLLWVNRWGRTRRLEVGAEVLQLRSEGANRLWSRSAAGVRVYGSDGVLIWRMDGVVAMAPSPMGLARAQGEFGALLRENGVISWIDAAGMVLFDEPLASRDTRAFVSTPPPMAMDCEGAVWMAGADGELVAVTRGEPPRRWGLGSHRLLLPVVDCARHRVVVAAADGSVYAIIDEESLASSPSRSPKPPAG